MISLDKLKIYKNCLRKNLGDFGKLILHADFEKLLHLVTLVTINTLKPSLDYFIKLHRDLLNYFI